MLSKKEAILAIGKKMGLSSFHSEMCGGNGSIANLDMTEVIRIIYGQRPSSKMLRTIATKEKKRLFKRQYAKYTKRNS